MELFCENFQFINRIWLGSNAWTGWSVLLQRSAINLARTFECCKCCRKDKAKLTAFFVNVERRQPTLISAATKKLVIGWPGVQRERFRKYTSGWLLLEEPWISLKITPIAVAVKICNSSYQKEGFTFFLFWDLLQQICGNFYENFYQNFSGT